MRSRAELLLRSVAIAAIIAWIVNAMVPRAGRVAAADSDGLRTALPKWTADARLRAIHVQIDTMPDAASAAWLAALRNAGTPITWQGDALVPMAIETYPAADPTGGTVVLASAGTTSMLSDALGALDTLRAGRPSVVQLASLQGEVALVASDQAARVAPATAPAPKRLYVAGPAGWEGKFLVAALEEAGWQVDARFFIAPGEDVVQARTPSAPDSARHAAVILLDSASAETIRNVEAFVRAGGGVILAGDASRARRAANLVRWRTLPRETAPLGTLPGDPEWRGLSRVPLRLVADTAALALETRGGGTTVAVRRHYTGRVAAVGYDATWRWRMAGGDQSVGEHRAWWNRLVAGVAMRPAPVSGPGAVTGAAPIAALNDVLGAASPAAIGGASWPRGMIGNVLGLIAFAALLGEWLLRRARGAR